MGERRGTPSYNVRPAMQSPRYGGCASAFFHLFDWTSAKRLSSTKRLAAGKSEKGSFRRSRSFRTDHGKTRMRQEAQLQNATENASTRRAPGVVARLMGLDSLPEAPDPRPRGRPQSCSRAQSHKLRPDESHRVITTPVLLQDLLKEDLKKSSKMKSLRQRLPALFTTKRAHGRQFEAPFTRRSSRLTAFRCRSEEWCVSPAYFDIPQAQSRFLYAMTQKPKGPGSHLQLPFRSRLGSTSSIHGEEIPELSLRASSTGREILLQGWPLATQHNVPRDLYHEEGESSSDCELQASESVGSRPTDSASSRPFLTNSNSVMVQGKRRSSSWNGSDDGESTIEKSVAAKPARRAPPPPRHRIMNNEIEFKATRRGSCSRSRAPEAARTSSSAKREFDRQPLMENSRTSVSHKSVSTGSQSSITSDLRSVSSKPPRERSPDHSKSVNSATKSSVKSPAMAAGNSKPPGVKKARQPKGFGSSSLDSHSDVSQDGKHHLPKASRISNNGRKEADKSHSSPKLQRFTEKVAAGGVTVGTQKGIHKPKIQEQAHGDRLRNSTSNAEDMASHSMNNVDNHEEAVLRSKRVEQEPQHARARSVDDLFPELPLNVESGELFSHSSPDIDFSECRNGAGDQISMSPLIDYDELYYSGEYGKDGGGIMTRSPLIDCDFELRGLRGFNVHVNPVAEVDESASVESYPWQEVLELRWEDEIVETILSGRCCERSCSGPSISSRSVTFSDGERNEDSWSSGASHNPRDCDSCSDALSGSPRTNLEVKVIDVEPEALQAEPNSPPMQFVQKTSLEEGVIVDDAAGQPSPVSILQSPFHDEACTTTESSPESTRQCCSSPSDPVAVKCHAEKLKQALLDLSTFQAQQQSASTAAAPQQPPHSKDDHHFIHQVLAAANFLSAPNSCTSWHAQHTPMDPALFEKLESEGRALSSGGLWRWDRKLMFDCVNEALGAASWGGGVSLGGAEAAWRLKGRALVAVVEKSVSEWKRMRGLGVDDLVERDIGAELGCWKTVGRQVVEVAAEVEGLLWEGMLEEVVVDLSGGESRRPRSPILGPCLQ